MTTRAQHRIAGQPPSTIDQQFGDEITLLVPLLRRFAFRLCGQHALAEDLTQEAIMRSWAARATYIQNTDLRAWVCVILRNCFYSTLRRRKWSANWDADLAERILIIPPAQDNALLLSDAMKAIEQLSSGQREALMLVGVEGLSYEEAAAKCGCTLGTIKSRMSRGRRAIAQTIDGPDDALLFQRCAQQNTGFATLSRKGA